MSDLDREVAEVLGYSLTKGVYDQILGKVRDYWDTSVGYIPISEYIPSTNKQQAFELLEELLINNIVKIISSAERTVLKITDRLTNVSIRIDGSTFGIAICKAVIALHKDKDNG